ncbi:MAG: cation transporter [Kiritimatiellae bacterium]|nr:cation transporter [Kiritimatiellia bacterium]
MTDTHENRTIRRVTYVGMLINAVLAFIKIAVGGLARSSAVVADGVHSLSDMFTDAAIIAGSRYWDKPADSGHPHGHRRIETAVTLFIGLTLATVAFNMAWRAVTSIHAGEHHTPGRVAMVAALISIFVKEILYRWTLDAGHRIHSMPLVANAWHHRSDAWSSIPAAAAAGLATLGEGWGFIDQVGAIAVAIIVLHAAMKISWPAAQQLMDSAGPRATVNDITNIARSTAGVRDAHRVRTRYMGGSRLSVDMHVLVDGTLTVSEGHDIATAVRKRLIEKRRDIVDVVVHTEPFTRQEIQKDKDCSSS